MIQGKMRGVGCTCRGFLDNKAVGAAGGNGAAQEHCRGAVAVGGVGRQLHQL